MTAPATARDYSLNGRDSGPGFADAEWYRTPVPRKRMKELMARSDRAALMDFGLWAGLTLAFAALLVWVWGTVWAWPVALVYGVFYASGAESRWHEYGHGTPMRTRWMSDAIYHLASFMSLKNPVLWRWSHARHHTDTVIVGRDPEIAFPRPPSLATWVLNLLHVVATTKELWKSLRLSLGLLTQEQRDFLPESQRPKAFRSARFHVGVLMLTGISAIAMGSWLPLVLIGGPTYYGSWLHHVMATTQHAGLAEECAGFHRLISPHRSVLNRGCSGFFIYFGMNYTLNTTMLPRWCLLTNLPALHEEIRPTAHRGGPSLPAAYREIVPAQIRQQNRLHHLSAASFSGGGDLRLSQNVLSQVGENDDSACGSKPRQSSDSQRTPEI